MLKGDGCYLSRLLSMDGAVREVGEPVQDAIDLSVDVGFSGLYDFEVNEWGCGCGCCQAGEDDGIMHLCNVLPLFCSLRVGEES